MSKVWDCFLFNCELELLSFRLNELSQCVDFFVLVEATTTFRGEPKPLYYAQNKSSYQEFQNQIIHVVVDDMPTETDSPRAREKYQHAAILKGLVDIKPDDLVIVGDLDEIPKCGVIKELSSNLSQPTRLLLNHSIYFANWQLPRQWDDGPMACRGNQLQDKHMAFILGQPEATWNERTDLVFPNAGWHLSYLGGVNSIKKKFSEICHTELDNSKNRNTKYLENCILFGVDYTGKYLLNILKESELDPMLERLKIQFPEAFSFPKNHYFFLSVVYRSYVHLRYLSLLPNFLVKVIDDYPILFCIFLSFPIVICDFSYRTLLKYRLRFRLKQLLNLLIVINKDKSYKS